MPELLSTLASLLASLVTACGVGVAIKHLKLLHIQSMSNFEDAFAKEYRVLASMIPTKALLGESLSNREHRDSFDEFYHYFDMCNEQAFLNKSGRISPQTWIFWRDGMFANMQRPAFSRAWLEVATRSDGDFLELRELFPVHDRPVSRDSSA